MDLAVLLKWRGYKVSKIFLHFLNIVYFQMAESYVPDEAFFNEDPFPLSNLLDMPYENSQPTSLTTGVDRQLSISLLASQEAERKRRQELLRRQLEENRVRAARQKEIETQNRKFRAQVMSETWKAQAYERLRRDNENKMLLNR